VRLRVAEVQQSLGLSLVGCGLVLRECLKAAGLDPEQWQGFGFWFWYRENGCDQVAGGDIRLLARKCTRFLEAVLNENSPNG